MQTPLNVLILCTANSARSILAEAILASLAGDRFCAFSAGSHPRGEPNPNALALLGKKGHETAGLRSKSWDEFTGPDAPVFDLVITVCDNAAGEACPAFPGPAMRAHWGIADPAGAADEPAAFEAAYAQLAGRMKKLVALEVEKMSREAFMRHVHRIGTMEGATSVALSQAEMRAGE